MPRWQHQHEQQQSQQQKGRLLGEALNGEVLARAAWPAMARVLVLVLGAARALQGTTGESHSWSSSCAVDCSRLLHSDNRPVFFFGGGGDYYHLPTQQWS